MTCKDLATTVGIVALLSVSMLLAGCEYAIHLSISPNVEKIELALNGETACAIMQKYLAANNEHRGLIGYRFETVGSGWRWEASGAPTLATVRDGIVSFEATPSWFVNSKFEMDLTRVRGVVFWDPMHTRLGVGGRLVELQWSDPEDTGGLRAPGSRSGTPTLHMQDGNKDVLIAALKYFAPMAYFIASTMISRNAAV